MANVNETVDKLKQGNPSPINEESLLETGFGITSKDSTLSNILRGNGFGGLGKSIVSTLYGFDITGTAPPAPLTAEHPGLTFFTRPLLNLSYDNIRNDRSFALLDNPDPDSTNRYVRAMLDPMSDWHCPAVDPLNPFIPLLTNTVTSVSGWQEPILENYTTPSDRVRGQISMVDSAPYVNQIYPLSVNFRNIRTNPLGLLFHIWTRYMGLVYEGIFDPHPPFIAFNVKDYETRIYRVILDPSKRFVEEIIACVACYPLTDRAATRGDFNEGQWVNRDVDTYSQTFQATGAMYYDAVTVDEFNRASTFFNPNFADPEKRRSTMRQLWPAEYKPLSYRAYPFINPRTAEFEWWISKEVHREMMGQVDYGSFHEYNQSY